MVLMNQNVKMVVLVMKQVVMMDQLMNDWY